MTHAELVVRAEMWLRTLGCGVTFREYTAYTSTGEIPDVIGWSHGKCLLVEVKVSRADFLSDKNKKHRRPEISNKVLGNFRFYVTLPGIVKPEEVPSGWGLYELRGRGIYYTAGVRYANGMYSQFQSNRRDELAIMYSALRRLEIRGLIKHVYEERPEINRV